MENKEPTHEILELDASLLLAKPRNDQLLANTTVEDGDGKIWRVTILPFRGWSLRFAVQTAAQNHVEACKGGVTLDDGTVVKLLPTVMRTATHLAHRIMSADGTPLMGEPLAEGFARWCQISESDATLWNNLVWEMDSLDAPIEELEEIKNDSGREETMTSLDEPEAPSGTNDEG
jgi:hypothetical protein